MHILEKFYILQSVNILEKSENTSILAELFAVTVDA